MTEEREAIVRIAKGLDKDVRECVRLGFRYVTTDIMLRAEDKGLCDLSGHITPLGQAVRDHLKESTHE